MEQLVKSWAQEHNRNFVIADYDNSEQALVNTQGFFTWVVRESEVNIDLVSLIDDLEEFLQSRKKDLYTDGMFCQKCGGFFQFAEPNQEDGSLICYSCRSNPYG